jgi:hypothetical protein
MVHLKRFFQLSRLDQLSGSGPGFSTGAVEKDVRNAGLGCGQDWG